MESLINVSWSSNGSDVASFSEAVAKTTEGFGWATANFVNGDFSLVVLTASLDLQGVYECKVGYNSSMLHSSNITFRILGVFFSWQNSGFNLKEAQTMLN